MLAIGGAAGYFGPKVRRHLTRPKTWLLTRTGPSFSILRNTSSKTLLDGEYWIVKPGQEGGFMPQPFRLSDQAPKYEQGVSNLAGGDTLWVTWKYEHRWQVSVNIVTGEDRYEVDGQRVS